MARHIFKVLMLFAFVNFMMHDSLTSMLMADNTPSDRYEKLQDARPEEKKIEIYADEELTLLGSLPLPSLIADKTYVYQSKHNISFEACERPFKPPRHFIS